MFSSSRHIDMFKPRTNFVPVRIEEPDMDDPDQSPIVIPEPKETKPKRYCGEKLLRKLAKERKKEKKVEKKEINIDQMSQSLMNMMKEMNVA